MGMISKEEALARLAAAWNPTPRPEWVPLGQACGRILAEPALARHSLPVVRAALMDGVALASGEFAHGRPDTASWKEGVQYARADMGDDFDDRFDACIPVEQVTFLEDGGLALAEEAAITPGTGIRERGTTVLEGQLLLSAGLKITPVDLGVLAMGGIESVPVRKRPVVAILPTGSELVPRGSPPARGQTLDSNSIMLEHMLLEMGAETICYPIVKDLIMPREGVFAKVLTPGSISAGDEMTMVQRTAPQPYQAAVITLSDKGSRGEREDTSGPAIVERLSREGYQIVEAILLSDDQEELEQQLRRLCDQRQPDLILTTGGTGFSPRDHAPEATLAVADRMAPGIAEAIRAHSLSITPRAMLSRGAAP